MKPDVPTLDRVLLLLHTKTVAAEEARDRNKTHGQHFEESWWEAKQAYRGLVNDIENMKKEGT